MKKNTAFILSLLMLLIYTSCSSDSDSKDSETGLLGTWKLSEVMADPGDGSGTFQKVESNKVLVFNADKTITSNGVLGSNSITSNTSTSGTYSIDQDSGILDQILGIITPSLTLQHDFEINPSINIHFEVKESALYVHYPSIEASSAKYIRK